MLSDFLPKIFEHLLPALWRSRHSPNPERNDYTLAKTTDTDPIYRALMDHAAAQLEIAANEMTQPHLPPGVTRDFLAGRCHGLVRFIQEVESTRNRSRQLQIEAMKARARSRPG